MKTQYLIAGIFVQVDAPNKLRDNEAYALYRLSEDLESEETESDHRYEVSLIKEEEMKLPSELGNLVFVNEMHNVYETGTGKYLHLFHIPFSDGLSSWNWIEDKNEVEIHYACDAESYFSSSTGVFNSMAFERCLYSADKYLFHCSFVDYKGNAILFSAPSGGGKTTQGKLWEEFVGATMVNGDRAVLEKTTDGYLAHGLPIAGSSGVFLNRTLPLKAIFVVKKSTENKVVRLNQMTAFKNVLSELTVNTWNKEFMNDAVDFALELVNSVPVYELSCDISKAAVSVAKNVIDISEKK